MSVGNVEWPVTCPWEGSRNTERLLARLRPTRLLAEEQPLRPSPSAQRLPHDPSRPVHQTKSDRRHFFVSSHLSLLTSRPLPCLYVSCFVILCFPLHPPNPPLQLHHSTPLAPPSPVRPMSRPLSDCHAPSHTLSTTLDSTMVRSKFKDEHPFGSSHSSPFHHQSGKPASSALVSSIAHSLTISSS